MPRDVDDGEVRLLRQDAQLLNRRRKLSPVQVVRRLLGVQSQMFKAGHLAIRARAVRPVATDIEHALTRERSLVWTWAMRGTLHLVTAEDYGWLVPLMVERSIPGAVRRLQQEGVGRDDYHRARRMIGSMLSTEGPLTRSEIAVRLGEKGVPVDGQAIAHTVWLASAQGLICRGPAKNGERAFVLVKDWLDTEPAHRGDSALKELALRYLKSHGPATPEDLVKWSGLPLRDVRVGWAEISSRMREVNVGPATMWMLRSQETDVPDGVVRLVPAFEEFLLGWRDRSFSLTERHAPRVIAGGIFRPAIMVDGRVVGTWSTSRRRDAILVTCHTFGRISSALREELSTEVSDVGRFLGTSAEIKIQ